MLWRKKTRMSLIKRLLLLLHRLATHVLIRSQRRENASTQPAIPSLQTASDDDHCHGLISSCNNRMYGYNDAPGRMMINGAHKESGSGGQRQGCH